MGTSITIIVKKIHLLVTKLADSYNTFGKGGMGPG